MKKWISVLTVMVMLCVTCLSAAAAPSPSKNTIAQSGTIVTKDGEKISIDNPVDLSKYLQVEDTDELKAEEIQNYLSNRYNYCKKICKRQYNSKSRNSV